MAPIPNAPLLSLRSALLKFPRSLSTISIPHPRLESLRQLPRLIRRQNVVAVPQAYGNQADSSQPGTVAGIVIGSVAGVLLILWLIYTCFNLGGGPVAADASEVEVVRRRSRSPSRRHRSASEVIEVREHHRPRRERSPRRRETVIIEETRTRDAPPVIIADDSRSDDIIEVIEEHSPPPRRRERRQSGGYRTVDPDAFAGGSDRPRHVRGSRRG